MNKALRKTVIAGNWKMNKNPSEAVPLLEKIRETVTPGSGCEVVVCVPYVDLHEAIRILAGSGIAVGAQNVHWAESGAFTGEVSAPMLKSMGVEYVIIGHSERRKYFAENDATVNQKVQTALSCGLTPIICVGETEEDRKRGITNALVSMQTGIALMGLEPEAVRKVIIAYEPIWAIGTGLTATAEQAEEVNGVIRRTLINVYGAQIAEAVTIQYGGSMNAANAAELLAKPNVDGGLIGGASLKATDFAAIVEAAKA